MTSGKIRRTQFTTPYERGDVVLVAFPFTDLTTTKKRPAVVISPDSFNSLNQDLILAAITAQPGSARFSLRINSKDFANGGLPKPSRVRLVKVFTIHSALIVKRIGTLNSEKIREILTALRGLYS